MSETYVECLVAKKPSVILRFFKVLLIMLAVVFLLFGLVSTMFALAVLIAIIFGVGAYFATMNADVEYEYLYLDKEITVDKVMAKSRRKKAGTFSIDKMEIMAPLTSHRLDSYQNRAMKKSYDFSSGVASQPEQRYMLIFSGDTRVILEPNREMIKAIQTVAPRKVFTD